MLHVPEIIVGDITTLEVDAMVNAANSQLAPGGGVCGSIHRGAGLELAEACQRVAPCPTGEARITDGFLLPARYVIHTVGPIYHEGESAQRDQLASCYRNSLQLAQEHQLESIAFPCISTGIYGFPLRVATEIALSVMCNWLADTEQPKRIICCCFQESDAVVYREILNTRPGREM